MRLPFALLLPLAMLFAPCASAETAAPATKPAAATTAPAKPAAVRCRDNSGKFIACPKAPVTVRCRDAGGKFIACKK
jgi:hypothetical protein